jgi:hypothetical protein
MNQDALPMFHPSFRLNVTSRITHDIPQFLSSHLDTVPCDLSTIQVLRISMTYLKKKKESVYIVAVLGKPLDWVLLLTFSTAFFPTNFQIFPKQILNNAKHFVCPSVHPL